MSHLQTSRQNTAGTLAWKSDSTSEKAAAGGERQHLLRLKKQDQSGKQHVRQSLQLLFRISRT